MIRPFLRVIATAAVAVGCAACGKETPTPTPTATPATTPAVTPPVTLVSLAGLRASVPELRGWTRGDVVAQESTSEERGTQVVTTFTRESEKLELEIADTGGAAKAIESLEHIAGSNTNRTVGNGYFKGSMLGTFPAVESFNTQEKLGEVSVLIRRRFIIHVAGSGIKDAAPMRALAQAVDTSRLR
ncbi:MAG TPA: hypothetical protein VMZ90_14805 [Vicinamibacterales bacterium]|nr:hypothetical protein [Vicinamibacterales bacterium]